MSVGCTRLLLASGSAPDRFSYSYRRVRFPARARRVIGTTLIGTTLYVSSGLPITFVFARSAICFLHNRLDLRQLASSLPGAQRCRSCGSTRASYGIGGYPFLDRCSPRKQRFSADGTEDTRRSLIFRDEMCHFGHHFFGQEAHRLVPGVGVFAV